MSKITNLAQSPQYIDQTLGLIEKSFGYSNENKFNVDFYPLYNRENFKNCFIYIENNEVIAHIGSRPVKIQVQNKLININMYGGISVDENHRGKGIFKELFNEVLNLDQESAFQLLWSDQIEMYKKFNFYPCQELFVYDQEKCKHKYVITKTKLIDISKEELETIKILYNSSPECRVARSEKDWEDLKNVISSDLYLIKTNQIQNYFLMNKGQDLTQIIHEYGIINENFIQVMRNYGNLWCSQKLDSNSNVIIGTSLRINNKEHFKEFIHSVSPLKVSNIHESINFDFENDSLVLGQEEFIQGILGPGKFKEFKTPSLYICGLDSI